MMRPFFTSLSAACCSLGILTLAQCGGSSSDAEGLAPFQQPYDELDALHGREVAVQLGEQSQSGRALGIAADGALRVEIEGVERLFHSGEVSVRRR